jgi:hypothetical protein
VAASLIKNRSVQVLLPYFRYTKLLPPSPFLDELRVFRGLIDYCSIPSVTLNFLCLAIDTGLHAAESLHLSMLVLSLMLGAAYYTGTVVEIP